MINFIWIVLITIASAAISAIIVIFVGYVFYDSILKFILKRRVPTDKREFLDGGPDFPTDEKEVKLQDGQFREYERLRESAIGKRTAERNSPIPRFLADESRDEKIGTIASEFNKPDIRGDEEEW